MATRKPYTRKPRIKNPVPEEGTELPSTPLLYPPESAGDVPVKNIPDENILREDVHNGPNDGYLTSSAPPSDISREFQSQRPPDPGRAAARRKSTIITVETSKRLSPSLNAVTVGILKVGTKISIVREVKISPDLIFAELPDKTYFVLYRNGKKFTN